MDNQTEMLGETEIKHAIEVTKDVGLTFEEAPTVAKLIKAGWKSPEEVNVINDDLERLIEANGQWSSIVDSLKAEIQAAEKHGYDQGVEDRLRIEEALQQRNDQLRVQNKSLTKELGVLKTEQEAEIKRAIEKSEKKAAIASILTKQAKAELVIEETKKQLKLADTNYLTLKNEFDDRIQAAREEERKRIKKLLKKDYVRTDFNTGRHEFAITQEHYDEILEGNAK